MATHRSCFGIVPGCQPEEPMAKADLQADQTAYDAILSMAREAERAGLYGEALEHATRAWPHLEGMMQFERRWEGAEFRSVPCIDLVLRLAPPLLHERALNALGELLKARKSIDRHASDDLAARLRLAREQLQLAYRLWRQLETAPSTPQVSLGVVLGAPQSVVLETLDRWVEMGIAARAGVGSSLEISLSVDLGRPTLAKCPVCGTTHTLPRRQAVAATDCPDCNQRTELTLLATKLDT